MTNNELNKAIAEIVGYEADFAGSWSASGELVEKYKVDVFLHSDEADLEWWAAQAQGHTAVMRQDTPCRAICLAVLAAEGRE